MRSRLQILLVTSTFPRDESDRVTARFVLDLARHLTSHADVFVLAPATPKSPPEERWDSVRVLRFRYFTPRSAQRLTSGEGILARMQTDRLARAQLPILVGAEWLALPRAIRDHRIDVVNSHWLLPQGLLAASWQRPLGVAHVATAHAADVALLQRLPQGRRVARYIFARTDWFLPVSSYLQDSVRQLLGYQPRASVIPMGVSTEIFSPDVSGNEVRARLASADERLILFVGKLVEKKGLAYLIDAIAELRRRGLPVRLVVVGGGPLEEATSAQVERLSLSSAVTMVGWCHNREVPAYFAAADVVCVPSVIDGRGETEGMPVVVHEAMASGCILVASRISGIPDCVHDQRDGILVEPANSSALADGIARALALSASERSSMAINARSRAENNTWARIAERYMDTFTEAMEGVDRRKT